MKFWKGGTGAKSGRFGRCRTRKGLNEANGRRWKSSWPTFLSRATYSLWNCDHPISRIPSPHILLQCCWAKSGENHCPTKLLNRKLISASLLFSLYPIAARYLNEEAVGRAVKDYVEKSGVPRSELFITSKLWDADHERATEAIEDSLKKLQLDYVDLYLIHSPGNMGPDARIKAWKDLEAAVDAGKIKSIGVSNVSSLVDERGKWSFDMEILGTPWRKFEKTIDCMRQRNETHLLSSLAYPKPPLLPALIFSLLLSYSKPHFILLYSSMSKT